MLYVVVNGGWGRRQESVVQIAERWVESLSALGDLNDAAFTGWLEAVDDISTAPRMPLSVAALSEYLKRENPESDVDRIGYTASLLTNNPGMPRVTFSIHAGGTSEWVTNSVAVSFRSRKLDESVPTVSRSSDVLRILADAWDIDTGQAYGRAQYDAVRDEFGLDNSAPRCGRSVYLSAKRAALAPEGFSGTYARTAHGGLIIDLTRGGIEEPDIETILDANRQLRAAGALEPLPEPLDRSKW
ncbi:Imm52 family immunity protein [Streptomyces sp. NPDC019208]|uniref:Imm52 family immunity protein n=1 Tax=Streptomyces sp. NPDC019208 TaxID=3154683 RepID=UPI00340BD237